MFFENVLVLMKFQICNWIKALILHDWALRGFLLQRNVLPISSGMMPRTFAWRWVTMNKLLIFFFLKKTWLFLPLETQGQLSSSDSCKTAIPPQTFSEARNAKGHTVKKSLP